MGDGVAWAATAAAPVPTADDEASALYREFAEEYGALAVPELTLAYADNLGAIQSEDGIARQHAVLERTATRLAAIGRAALSQPLRVAYDELRFELDLGLERVELERRFRAAGGEIVPGGLGQQVDGARWYALYLKRWTSSRSTPAEVKALGEQEVERVDAEIRRLQAQLGFAGRDGEFLAHLADASFLITDEIVLQDAFAGVRATVAAHLGGQFLETDIPEVGIEPIADAGPDTPPGYYEDGTFYYNFFGGRFQRRNLDWLFLHEAVPGHHYQSTLASRADAPPFARYFWYPGFSEGWGAYGETLGHELGVYRDAYAELGKWEWDLVRSARLVMDVGLNFEHWTRAEALAYWHAHIRGQDAIAEREINRMLRWPAQVASYKVGEARFAALRRRCVGDAREGDAIRGFHHEVLRRGSLPLDALTSLLDEAGACPHWRQKALKS
jgi:uncharacterized protein (DUF885 family)